MIDTKELRKLVYRHAQVTLSIPIKPAMLSELLDRLEAVEKERDAAELMSLALRAKIEQMERQEPVAWLHEVRRNSHVVTSAVKHIWGKTHGGSMAAYSIPLYLTPDTHGEKK